MWREEQFWAKYDECERCNDVFLSSLWKYSMLTKGNLENNLKKKKKMLSQFLSFKCHHFYYFGRLFLSFFLPSCTVFLFSTEEASCGSKKVSFSCQRDLE